MGESYDITIKIIRNKNIKSKEVVLNCISYVKIEDGYSLDFGTHSHIFPAQSVIKITKLYKSKN